MNPSRSAFGNIVSLGTLAIVSIATVASFSTPGVSASDITKRHDSSLLGTWSLVETKAYTSDGSLNYAPTVRAGIFMFGDNTYSLMWTRETRPDPAQHWNATESERLISFGTMIAHAGGYDRDGNMLTLRARTAKSPEFEGGNETFRYSVANDTLRMTAIAAESRSGVQVPFYVAAGWQDYVLVKVD